MTMEEKIALLEAEIEKMKKNDPLAIKERKLVEARLKLEALIKADNENSMKAQELETSEEFLKLGTLYYDLKKDGRNNRAFQDAERKYMEKFSEIRQLRTRDKGAKSDLTKEILRLSEDITAMKDGVI